MKSRKRTRKRVLLLVGAALLLLAVILAAMRGGDEPTAAGPYVPPPATKTPTLDPSPSAIPPSASPGAAAPQLSGFPTAGVPGLQGDSWTKSGGRHSVTVAATSDNGLAALGWRIPTARKSGTRENVTRFSASGIAWGYPDYAQILVIAGPASNVAECTITVDGKVTAHKVARGPWAQAFCQG